VRREREMKSNDIRGLTNNYEKDKNNKKERGDFKCETRETEKRTAKHKKCLLFILII